MRDAAAEGAAVIAVQREAVRLHAGEVEARENRLEQVRRDLREKIRKYFSVTCSMIFHHSSSARGCWYGRGTRSGKGR